MCYYCFLPVVACCYINMNSELSNKHANMPVNPHLNPVVLEPLIFKKGNITSSRTHGCGMPTNLGTEGAFPSSVSGGGGAAAPSPLGSGRGLLSDCDRFTTARAKGDEAELE